MSTAEQIAALEKEKAETTNIYVAQENIIKTLTDIFEQQQHMPETVWVQPPAAEKPPNYLLWIGAGILAFFFFRSL